VWLVAGIFFDETGIPSTAEFRHPEMFTFPWGLRVVCPPGRCWEARAEGAGACSLPHDGNVELIGVPCDKE